MIYHFSEEQTICRTIHLPDPQIPQGSESSYDCLIDKFGSFSELLENAEWPFLKNVEAHLLGRTRFARPIDGGDAEDVSTRGQTLK